MNLSDSKVLAIVILGAGTFFVGLLPAFFARHGRRQWPLVLSSLLCFGAGVLLATSLVHILPESRKALKSNGEYAELIFCSGFFMLYIIDEIVHFFYGETHEIGELGSSSSSSNHSHFGNGAARRHSHCAAIVNNRNYGSNLRTEYASLLEKPPPYNPGVYRARSDGCLFAEDDRIPSQLCHVSHQEPCHTAPTVNIGLLVALSVHAMLEGLVVGLEDSSTKVLLLLGAIASHKLVVGFCLGVEIASNPASTFCRQFISIFIFTIGSLGGIIIGMLLTNIPSDFNQLGVPILQGIAGGTLFYVTVSEILPRERARWHQENNRPAAGVWQFISVVIGFALMTGIDRYLEHED